MKWLSPIIGIDIGESQRTSVTVPVYIESSSSLIYRKVPSQGPA
jgi:hypothetical protein